MSQHKQNRSIANYEHVDPSYLKKRQLQKSAGWLLLWALGVGAVISGDYFGWNFGLTAGGFGGLALATVLMAAMYVCLVFTIAELSAALPHAGGFYSFTRSAFGPMGGFICGVTDTIEYVITPAVIVVGIGGYMNTLIPGVPPYLWWLIAYTIFVAINIRGVNITLKVGLVITVLAVGVLVFFLWFDSIHWGPSTPNFSSTLNLRTGKRAPGYRWDGWAFFAALPFAIWFYLAIEQLPLAAEETHDVVRDMPKALIWGIVTLLILSLFTLVLNTGVGGGAAAIGASDAPLQEGFKAIFGSGVTTTLLTIIALTGLIASFHTIIYAYGRVLFALSRAGYFPRWISITGKNHTPYVALILGAVIGYIGAVIIDLQGGGAVGAALLNMAVFGAVISYAMVMFSYIRLKVTRPNLERPYKSPLGMPGAIVGAVLSLIALAACLSIPDYRPGVWGTAVFLGVAILYFLLYSRHHLVAEAPEEEVALMAEAQQELAH